ncbi:hypothetical protein XENTR_v10009202 [Xenopus tropicalis]|nr:hypothetical protein XENTR_v10009202 [Xenopus tropicalis]
MRKATPNSSDGKLLPVPVNVKGNLGCCVRRKPILLSSCANFHLGKYVKTYQNKSPTPRQLKPPASSSAPGTTIPYQQLYNFTKSRT